jgi:hypothetical protein
MSNTICLTPKIGAGRTVPVVPIHALAYILRSLEIDVSNIALRTVFFQKGSGDRQDVQFRLARIPIAPVSGFGSLFPLVSVRLR